MIHHRRLLPNIRLTLGIAATIGATLSGVMDAQQTPPKHGDVSGDGVVSALDAQAILTAVVGLPLPNGYIIANGDADCNTTSAALDAQIVLSFVIGLNTSQYCVGQPFGAGATTIAISPMDSSLLINRGMAMRATLKDGGGFSIRRPIAWSTSNPSIVTIDSVKNDTLAFVKATANQGSSTITATSDGVSIFTQLKVFLSYAGIIITPQRGDTIRQIGDSKFFSTKNRDSVGVVSGNPAVFWTVVDTNIATITSPAAGVAATSATVMARGLGTTLLRAVSQSNPNAKDSVPVVVALPSVNSCVAGTGSLHQSVTYTSSQTWTKATNPHFVSGTVSFSNGADLTIEPGALVCLQSFATMSFSAGSHMTARGTIAEPITFTAATASPWGNIQFGSAVGYSGVSTDTSFITNALIERGGGSAPALYGQAQHMLVVDSVRLRMANNGLVQILGPGSRLSRSIVDTVNQTGGGVPAVIVGRGTVEATTIRNGQFGSGVSISEAGTLRNVNVIGGTAGVMQACCSATTVALNDVTISNVAGFGLDLQFGSLLPTSANVVISGGTGGSYRGLIGHLGVLFPDSVSQNTLKGNGRGDTVFVTGGTLTGKTLVVRPDLPWLISAQPTVDTLGQLVVRPGARLAFDGAGLFFQRGGTLTAIGEANKFISFVPFGTSTFFGLRFDAPGQGGGGAGTWPYATSTLTYVRVDSAQGQGVNTTTMCCYSAAINGATRHRLLMDSVVVRKSFNAAVAMAASGSYLKRGVIDTTGNVSTNYTASQPALVAGDTTSVENTLVRRSGSTGIYAPRNRALFTNVRVVASQNVALQADGLTLDPATSSVKADSANAYPFYGRIENFGIIASTAALQTSNFLGNVDNVAVIVGGTLTNKAVAVIQGLRWQVTGSPNVDTLATLQALPGADVTFTDGTLQFSRGGTLNAVGTPAAFIRFRPVPGSQWSGLRFDDPGPGGGGAGTWPYAVSTLTYVRVDSASGTGVNSTTMCCFSAAINGATRHRLLMDSVVVHKAWNAAVAMAASGSSLKRSLVDTTGNVSSNYTASQPAVIAGDTTIVENTLVRRSGSTGLYAPRNRALLTNVRVVASLNVALQFDNLALDPASTNVKADSANAYAFYGRIENFGTIANTAALQTANLLGNVDNLAVIVGGVLTNKTVAVIPALRWQVTQSPNIDTLATLQALPGADITFTDGMLHFSRGGTLNAVGTPASFIRFRPVPGNQWSGLRFDEPGAGGGGAGTWPYATSILTYVRLDSVAGTGVNATTMCCYSAGINGATRHRLLMDSIIVHKAFNTAVAMAASGSYLKRSLIDTTGAAGSNYTASQPALVAGDTTTVESSLVRRAGYTSIYAPRTRTLFTNVRVVASQNVALQMDGGAMDPASANVRADSANAYPFYGRIENFGTIANTAALQTANFLGNADNVAVIVGGTLVNRTVDVIPALRWQVTQSPNVDTLATLQAVAGADITFMDGVLQFSRGGTLNAVGTPASFVRFRPVPGSGWSGLRFDAPGPGAGGPGTWPYAVSTLTYVRVDSASGTGVNTTTICCFSAAINGATRHRLLMDSVIVHKAFNNAVSLAASGSFLRRSWIDTTGTASTNYVSNQAAVAFGDSIDIQNTLIRRSGNSGLSLRGTAITMSGTRVVRSLANGVEIAGGATGGTFGGFAVDSTTGVGVSIQTNNITVTNCDVLRGATHGFAATSNFSGITINDCNIGSVSNTVTSADENLGAGILNPAGSNFINAVNNWWGRSLSGAPIDPQQSNPPQNGISGNVNTTPPRNGPRVP
ncbi:MAG TPA: hypothetical protein VFT29_11275 [Gemmatimonadaceae bacterium]|nr:hypothetical protein [Gemmatimonadaceae bacterium]